MSLLPRINESKTQDNVKEYLKEDFPRLVMQAGYSMLEVQSPSFGGVGGSSNSYRNSLEDKIVDHFEVRPKVIATVKAINNCPGKYSVILKELYILNRRDWEVERDVNYGHTQYQNKKKIALLWFADAFQSTQDFHVYEEVSWKQFT